MKQNCTGLLDRCRTLFNRGLSWFTLNMSGSELYPRELQFVNMQQPFLSKKTFKWNFNLKMYYNINLDKIKEIISFPVRKVIPKFVCYTVCDVEFSKQKTLKASFQCYNSSHFHLLKNHRDNFNQTW